MLSEQVKQLREYADHLRTWKNIPLETNKTLLNQAADTIDELSAKLAAANMERSEAYYGSRSRYQDDVDYLHDMLAEGVTVGDRAVSLDDEDKAVIRRAIGALEKMENMERSERISCDCIDRQELICELSEIFQDDATNDRFNHVLELADMYAENECDKVSERHYCGGWIACKDRLPEVGDIVLVNQIYSWEKFEEGAAVTIGRLKPVGDNQVPFWEFQHYRPDFIHGTILDNGIICPGCEYVTHWMPLPEPYHPNEDTANDEEKAD